MLIMNIEYEYIRRRYQFGSPCMFEYEGPFVVANVMPDKSLGAKYITKSYVNKATQQGPIVAAHEINTWKPDFADHGIFHDEGGWPKELNVTDEDAVLRYKKKLEREENFIESMKNLSKSIEHAILQNNAINIYERYFEEYPEGYGEDETLSQLRNIFRDPMEIHRPISHISWSPNMGDAFSTAHCTMDMEKVKTQECCEAYIWNVEIPTSPQTVFDSKIPIVCLEWNPSDKNFLVGGLVTGQIAFYDSRKSPEHVDITTDFPSHRDPVRSILWINSKTGSEFFSSSSDGCVKWWDCRNLSMFIDSIILNKQQNMSLAHGASALDYDHSIPAKYLVGTETGRVICGNRKGTNIAEKLPWNLKCHFGPIYSVHRHSIFSKIFITVSDYSARIWSEECRESAIIWTKNYRHSLTCGDWSKSRSSVFWLTRADGVVELWDLLQDQNNPTVSVKLSNNATTTVRVEEQGKLIAVGDISGTTYLVQYGNSLATSAKNDKNILSAMFDRETHREKIHEGRMREIRLKKIKAHRVSSSKLVIQESRQEEILKAEELYWGAVKSKILEAQIKVTPEEPIVEEEDTSPELVPPESEPKTE